MSERAEGWSAPRWMLWVRLRWKRGLVGGEKSRAVILMERVGGLEEGGGEKRECRRRGMQPVPVQRSRIRRGGVGVMEESGLWLERRRCARWVVSDSVSGLLVSLN